MQASNDNKRFMHPRWSGPMDAQPMNCGICDAPIDEETVPFRLWTDDGHATVFCDACLQMLAINNFTVAGPRR